MKSFIEQSQPPEPSSAPPLPPLPAEAAPKIVPADDELRARALALRDSGGITNSKLASELGVNSSIVSQYLSPDGCTYPGDVAKFERKLEQWFRSHDLQSAWGIETIPTGVSRQFERAVEMTRRCRRMGTILGGSGLGKTRSAMLYADSNEFAILISAKRYAGDEESVRNALFKAAGIQGPRKHKGRRRAYMMRQLEQALRDTARPIIVDNAHRLSRPALQLLFDLHDETHSPVILMGVPDLEDKLRTDEQWASRIALRFDLQPAEDLKLKVNDWHALVSHQVRQLIPAGADAQDLKRLEAHAEKIARQDGHFRRVEMRLGMALYLRQAPSAKDATWCALFEEAGAFLPRQLDAD